MNETATTHACDKRNCENTTKYEWNVDGFTRWLCLPDAQQLEADGHKIELLPSRNA